MSETITDLLKRLQDIKEHEALNVFPCWRVGDNAGNGLNEIYPYYQADQCEIILDAIVGPGNWSCEFRQVKNSIYCSIGIRIGNEFIFKEDAGGARDSRKQSLTDVEKEAFRNKTEATDSFVRASAKWGIGRHLPLLAKYKLKVIDRSTPIVQTPNGEKLTGKIELSAWCNKVNPAIAHLMAVYKLNQSVFEDPDNSAILTALKEIIQANTPNNQ